MMTPNVQEQVIERIAGMETTPMTQIRLVADTLSLELVRNSNLLELKRVELKMLLIY